MTAPHFVDHTDAGALSLQLVAVDGKGGATWQVIARRAATFDAGEHSSREELVSLAIAALADHGA